jgi:hypothetical protein
MVFATAMLRAIDADKNASSTDTTSGKTITVSELFRAYPPLPNFLLAAMNGSISGVLGEQPPILPILLLFSQIQPITFYNLRFFLSFCSSRKFNQFHFMDRTEYPKLNLSFRLFLDALIIRIFSFEDRGSSTCHESSFSSIPLLQFCKRTIQSSLMLQHEG